MTTTEPIPETAVDEMNLPNAIQVKGGLYPFKHELFKVVEEVEAPPFYRLEAGEADLAFHVLDPFLVVEDYAPEVSDEDSETLELTGPEETQLLCIVNLNNGASKATINLVAPIVVNLRTGQSKQVILQNAAHYSVKHELFT